MFNIFRKKNEQGSSSIPKNCSICTTTIQEATSSSTGGKCMPCFKGTRYKHIAYLSPEDFFAKSSHDYCLAPNLDPHPSNADMKSKLNLMVSRDDIQTLIIPVMEFEEPDLMGDPYSDRVLIVGSITEESVADIAQSLKAEYYKEDFSGAEVPRSYSKGQEGWFIVWD